MIATVIICTRNRAASLARTLSSLATSAKRVREPWELIIVDNGSTDHTRDVVESFAAELPLARIDQPIPGLSNARNAGVAAAHGNYILWTDDDVIVDERWLTAWFATFKRRPHDVVFGGRSEPLLEEPHQPWFHANMGNLASLLAIRDEPTWGEVTVERIPYGLNYAIRASEQRAHLYDTNLGVAPGRRLGGEEVSVLRQILAEGNRGSWAWDATVYHVIPLSRQTTKYIDSFYSAHGYLFPVSGPRTGKLSRLSGVLASLKMMCRAYLKLGTAKAEAEVDVPRVIELARARGSLRRYLGLGV